MPVNAKPKVYTVSAVNSHISGMFRMDRILSNIYVRGELSNVKYASSGHLYFSMKDESSQIRCAMWASSVRNLKEQLLDGDDVIVYGRVEAYERDGTYQLYVTAVRKEGGVGALYEKFEALKQRLMEMGMFDASYKKPIPRFVRTLGVVTARTGAAVQDIITVSKRRNPGIQIILYPARVQGEGAAESIAQGLETLDRLGVDVILCGRGGGSIEDLWAFNEEIVANAIFHCKTPVISAVGHETDTTIADFAADLRAPTPSAGAELAVADMLSVFEMLEEKKLRMLRLIRQRIEQKQQALDQYRVRLKLVGPENRLQNRRLMLDKSRERMLMYLAAAAYQKKSTAQMLQMQLNALMEQRVAADRHRLENMTGRLLAMDPQSRLDAGYAYIENEEKKQVRSAAQIKEGEMLRIRFRDGAVLTQVKETEYGGEGKQKQ